MKKPLLWSVFATFLLFCWSGDLRTTRVTASDEQPPPAEQEGGIATLYALDPLARALCFHDGREGLMIRNHRVSKRCSDLLFSADDGRLVTGIEANRVGAIIDVGTTEDLRARYGQPESASAEIGFVSLRLRGEELAVLVLKEDRPQEKAQVLKEAAAVFASAFPAASAPISLGHIYVLRNADTKDSRFQLTVKLLVIGYTPNELVTVRWQRL